MSRSASLVAALLALTLAAGACSGGSASDEPTTTAAPTAAPTTEPTSAPAGEPAGSAYVALGDSFTAGPGIGDLQAGAGFCQRSVRNWPTLLASSLGLDLTDVSCAGATTADLASTLASLGDPSDARLVSVSAGGNDGSLFLSLIRACTGGQGACSSFVSDRAPAILAQTGADLARLLRSTVEAAPEATVVLVGYPRLMPSSGTCDTLGISADDVTTVAGAEDALDETLAEAATEAGVRYVSIRDASAGHDACAGAEAWTNGGSVDQGDGIVFHPNARGMSAIADLVAAAVSQG